MGKLVNSQGLDGGFWKKKHGKTAFNDNLLYWYRIVDGTVLVLLVLLVSTVGANGTVGTVLVVAGTKSN